MKLREITSDELADAVIGAMQEKKGFDIVKIDLRNIHNCVMDYFVICHASSVTQADALAEAVEMEVKGRCGLNPKSVEGLQHREWILLDYFDVVVHIFLEPVRSFYKLEDLWADGNIIRIGEK